MTAPAPQTLDREHDKRYVTDAEMIRRMGVPEKLGREMLKVLAKDKSFPKYGIFGKRRYWPAVDAWFLAHPDFQGKPIARADEGDVYFLADRTHVKIGFSASGVKRRARNIGQNHYQELEVLAVLSGVPKSVEKRLHDKFKAFHVKGEWFTRSREIEEFITNHRDGRWREELLP